MTLLVHGHPLNALRDGVVGFADEKRSAPTLAMALSVTVDHGLATIVTRRHFRNGEAVPIEALLTFPIGFDAALTGLRAKIDGRELHAVAQPREAAREAYEEALDRGKLAILHEEPLRGVHVVSVGALAPGSEVEVITEIVTPLANIGGTPCLRIPMTVGDLYGASPLLPADDLVTSENGLKIARLTIETGDGPALLDGCPIGVGPIEIRLDRALSLTFPHAKFGVVRGRDADGRAVTVTLERQAMTARPLDVAILFDRSGSTGGRIASDGETVWQAMRDGLANSISDMGTSDAVTLWQFDDRCERIGAGRGQSVIPLIEKIEPPRGGTEFGAAIRALAARDQTPDILVLTDGKTWAAEAQAAAGFGRRISAVLVGEDSFDAVIGHLASMTGGEVFSADGVGVATAVRAALASLRSDSAGVKGLITGASPTKLTTRRAGVSITITWDETRTDAPCDAVGRFAAALALPLVAEKAATDYAVAHGLCTHLTSLLIIDEAGAAVQGIPEQRKLSLAHSEPIVSMKMMRSSASMSSYASYYCEAPQRTDFRLPIEQFANLIDWDCLANQFLAGDLSGLDEEQSQVVIKFAVDQKVQVLAHQLDIDPTIVVICLLAKLASSRTAGRLAKKILGVARHEDIEEAMKVLQAPLAALR